MKLQAHNFESSRFAPDQPGNLLRRWMPALAALALCAACAPGIHSSHYAAGARPVPILQCVGSRIPRSCEPYRASAAEQQSSKIPPQPLRVPGPR